MAFRPDLIELQLAHRERNKVRAAYNRAERIAERRKMMQAWADYLDTLRVSVKAGDAVKYPYDSVEIRLDEAVALISDCLRPKALEKGEQKKVRNASTHTNSTRVAPTNRVFNAVEFCGWAVAQKGWSSLASIEILPLPRLAGPESPRRLEDATSQFTGNFHSTEYRSCPVSLPTARHECASLRTENERLQSELAALKERQALSARFVVRRTEK